MSNTLSSATLAQTLSAIQSLDLEPIKFKAMRSDDGYGWSAEQAEQLAVAYRRFLTLHAMHPERQLSPSRDVDRFWHMHILDTRKYADDCQAIFGRFLHHFPYFGLRGDDDARALQEAFEQTRELHRETFGEAMIGEPEAGAWCSVETAPAEAAWCSVEPTSAKAAWCSVEPAGAKAAWCSVEPASAKAAWCSVEPAGAKAAWCSVEPAGDKAAWCSVEPATADARHQDKRVPVLN